MNKSCEHCQYNGPYGSIINPCENCPNGDLFRNGSDERNAQWLSKLVFHNCATTFECHECHPDDEGCAEEILKWLKKEAKDGCL